MSRTIKVLLAVMLIADSLYAAQITVNIPDALQGRVVEALARLNGYQDEIVQNGVTIPNPVSKAQFARQVVINYIKETVKAYEADQAQNSALKSARDKVESEVSVT